MALALFKCLHTVELGIRPGSKQEPRFLLWSSGKLAVLFPAPN